MPIEPLGAPCFHIATPQEIDRDPNYLSCDAAPGQPCTWAKRHDGQQNPSFHAERFESASAANQATFAAGDANPQPTLNPETFREAILQTGLV